MLMYLFGDEAILIVLNVTSLLMKYHECSYLYLKVVYLALLKIAKKMRT